MKIKMIVGFIITLAYIKISTAQDDLLYFGFSLPKDTAEIFAPGIISKTDRKEGKIVFSPDGREIFFDISEACSIGNNRYNRCPSKVLCTKLINGKWTEQSETFFSANQLTGNPFFSSDGNRLYFDYFSKNLTIRKIWMIEKTVDGWSEPKILLSPFNTFQDNGEYTEADNGMIAFYAESDLWCKYPLSARFENLGPQVNSDRFDATPCFAHDGSYLIFSSFRKGNYSRQDLWITFNKGQNEWSEPINMERSGAKINLTHQVFPSLSPDGKILFFTRHSADGKIADIYWVSTNVIEKLKNMVFNSMDSKYIEPKN